MVTVTLDDTDREVLDRLRQGEATVETLATETDCSRDYLETRLPDLADNDLVERIDDEGDADRYVITESGRRTLGATPAGTADDRIDTPADVETRIESFDCRADGAAAIRSAFAFLRYWGDATAAEIVDAIYSEAPARYDTAGKWWDALVREKLASLPEVEAATEPADPWRYTGTPTVEADDEDGRDTSRESQGAPADPSEGFPMASVRYAVAAADLAPSERQALRAAFAHLAQRGEATRETLERAVYPEYDAGYDVDAWWEFVCEGFDQLPGVEPAGGDWTDDGSTIDDSVDEDSADGESGDGSPGDGSGVVWKYGQRVGGPTSTDPSAEPADAARDADSDEETDDSGN